MDYNVIPRYVCSFCPTVEFMKILGSGPGTGEIENRQNRISGSETGLEPRTVITVGATEQPGWLRGSHSPIPATFFEKKNTPNPEKKTKM